MRMYKKWILRICLLCLMFIAVIGATTSCKKQEGYTSNNYEYVEGIGTLNFNILSRKSIKLCVENSVCDAEEEIEQLYQVLKNDYELLERRFSRNTNITFYVIADDYILGEDGGVYLNDAVLCNLDTIMEGDYRLFLTAAYLNITEPWKQFGAYNYVFVDAKVDELSLCEYYSNDENLLSLTMFSAYFNDSFSGKEVIDKAKETAYAFSLFVIETYGFEEFLLTDLTSFRQDWLDKINCEQEFVVKYDLSWLNEAEYSSRLLQYPLVIETNNRTYYLDSISAKRESAAFDTPERVLKHLSVGYFETLDALSFIQNEISEEEYKKISNRFYNHIEYYVSDREIRTSADVDNSKIYLLDPSEYLHETIHILTLNENVYEGAWLAEGVAEYFSRERSDEPSDIDYRMFYSFTEETVTGALLEFVTMVKNYYLSIGGDFSSFSTFKFYLLEESIAYITLTNPMIKTKIHFPYVTESIGGRKYLSYKDDAGNELTYPESYVFTKYLINKYGLSKVLSCCEDYEFENIFNGTYNEIFLSFIETLS